MTSGTYFCLLLLVSIIVVASGQEQSFRRLGGRNGPVAPALGIKCTTAEIRAINEVVEECLEVALTVQLGVEEELAEEVMESTVDACKVVEACLTCTDLRAACLDDKTLREFKDSMSDVYLMLGLGLEQCPETQDYLSSGRPMQLVQETTCHPWQVFEADWNYRYCVSTITRAAITGSSVKDGFVLEAPVLDEELQDSEFGDLVALYDGEEVNFCDFSQFLLACGEQLHPCYQDNVIEVEVLKFLTTLYWLAEYEQPFPLWRSFVEQVGVDQVLQLAEHQQGDFCSFSSVDHMEL